MGEWARYWHDPTFGGVELLHASFITHSYMPHAHDGFAVGVIVAGAERFRYRGADHIASAGSIVAVNPGEIHTGEAAGDGWSYRMFYPPVELLQRAAEELAGRPQPIPFFGVPVMHDPVLAQQLRELHTALESTAEPLVRETLLISTLTAVVARHTDAPPAVAVVGAEPAAVAQARRFLDQHKAERPTLTQLSEHIGFSPFHLLRVFQRAVGCTPHAYLMQIRVREARRLLNKGLPPAEVAFLTGFADQSHLTRAFRRVIGVPPAQYARKRKIIQDSTG